MDTVTKEEFIKSDSLRDAELLKEKNERFKFNEGQYIMASNTLTGSGIRINGEEKKLFLGKIALHDISTFNLKKNNIELNTLKFLGVTTIALLVLALMIVGTIDFNEISL